MSKNIKSFLTAVFIVFLSNIFIYLLSIWTGVIRSEINLDYFLPLIFLQCRAKILFVISFIVVFFVDFINVFSQIFPFIHLSDLFYLLKFSFISSSIYKIYGLLLLLFLITQLVVVFKIFKKEQSKDFLIIFNIFLAIYGYVVYFGNDDFVNFWKPNGKGVVTSQTLNYLEYRNRGFIKNYEVEGNVFQNAIVEGATNKLFNKKQNYNKIFLIVNESWGVPLQESVQTEVMKSIHKSNKVEGFKLSKFDFEGFTIGGELRELCQVAPAHFNLKNQKTGFENCLPNLLRKQGYQTVAVHGALGLMYDRKDWYPRAGFSTVLFRDQGLNLPDSNCYSFPGNCDRDISLRINEKFRTHKKIFVYWLTLNTHAIYDKRDLVEDSFNCAVYKIDEEAGGCRNLKLQTQFFSTLGKMIEAGALDGAKVIVVGDHRPPIIKSEQTVFLDGQVPMLEFTVE